VTKQRIGCIRVGLMGHGAAKNILAELDGCGIRDLGWGKAR